MVFLSEIAAEDKIDEQTLAGYISLALGQLGPRKRVLIIPPDYTRRYSYAGAITREICRYYGKAVQGILPALGTHRPMTTQQIREFFGDLDPALFLTHHWQSELLRLGEIPASCIRELSEGLLEFSFPIEVNRLLLEGDFDLILSVGQVVPHEIVGMANHSKNIFVGVGGAEAIHKSHYLGAVYGMERIMGEQESPVRHLFDIAYNQSRNLLPICFIQTVVSQDLKLKGLFMSDDRSCFESACKLSQEININWLKKPQKKIVVYLDPRQYHTTWIGNKAIYRSRKALADGGDLLILAPGLSGFGEDPEIDRFIRDYSYCGRDRVMELVDTGTPLASSLAAAAHLIHGSTEGRFGITYCCDSVTKEEINSIGYSYLPFAESAKRYLPDDRSEGIKMTSDGEEYYYIENPAQGLWQVHERRDR